MNNLRNIVRHLATKLRQLEISQLTLFKKELLNRKFNIFNIRMKKNESSIRKKMENNETKLKEITINCI